MLPKHIYAPGLSNTRWVEGELVPGPPAWNVTGVSAPATSGLAALPLFSIVAQHIYDETYHADARHAVSFVESVFDSLYKYHDYLHTERAADGRVLLYHPWESELPTTSPVFSQLMREARASGGSLPLAAPRTSPPPPMSTRRPGRGRRTRRAAP